MSAVDFFPIFVEIQDSIDFSKRFEFPVNVIIFMNVKLNKKIQELDEVEFAYFMPSSGDESLPIGACFWMLNQKNEKGVSDEVVYLGKEYSDQEIESYMSEKGLDKKYSISKPRDISKEVSSMLLNGEIVGRFAGKAEWGARSLGNRAILADPSKLESVEVINNAIKCRDFWMPFAGSVLDSSFEDYAEYDWASLPFYMNTSFETTEQGRKSMKAAVHRKDYTMRPNVVTKKHNEGYYSIIDRFKSDFGIGGVLNTSLNVHGYPMVGFINELFFTMDNSELNHSIVGNYLISKNKR